VNFISAEIKAISIPEKKRKTSNENNNGNDNRCLQNVLFVVFFDRASNRLPIGPFLKE